MKSAIKIIFVVAVILIITIKILAAGADKTPFSKRVNSQKAEQSHRVHIRTSGIHNTIFNAKQEAEKAALCSIIEDHFLWDSTTQNKFSTYQKEFSSTSDDFLSEFSSFVEYRSGIEKEEKKDSRIRITMSFIINIHKLGVWLTHKGIITYTGEELLGILGRPNFFVMPDFPDKPSLAQIVDRMRTRQEMRIIAREIKTVLQKENFIIYLPTDLASQSQLNLIPVTAQTEFEHDFELLRNHRSFLNEAQSYAFRMGTDLCMTYSLRFKPNYEAAPSAYKLRFDVIDTITGERIASQIGIGNRQAGEKNQEKIIKEAVHHGLRLLKKQLFHNWQRQLEDGVPYLIAIHFQETVRNSTETIQLTSAVVRELSETAHTSASNDSILLFNTRINPRQFSGARQVRKAIRDEFNKQSAVMKLTNRGGLTGKWIQIEIRQRHNKK